MDTNDLLKKYEALLLENKALKLENEKLRYLLEVKQDSKNAEAGLPIQNLAAVLESSKPLEIPIDKKVITPSGKIQLFMSLFKGRDDVYAKRWKNLKGQSGYAPVCNNEWRDGVCKKPKVKCANCSTQSYAVLTEQVIEDHLRGNAVIGIYPLLKDDTSYFLAIDFDGGQWRRDVEVILEICDEFHIPVALERSRSGDGAHLWFFFDKPVYASTSRRFGASLLTCAMNRRHEMSFGSYDRMFPNQDMLPKGGFGNLIALPLQKSARQDGNSEFVDASLRPYEDQWAFLGSIQRLTYEDLKRLSGILSPGDELGALKHDDETDEKPWENIVHPDRLNELPSDVEIVRSNMLYIAKQGLTNKALNQIKRLAAFKNPEFYRAQAMRMPTYGKPRIISCFEEDEHYVRLPRGCEQALVDLLGCAGSRIHMVDKTNSGNSIDVEFIGQLRDEQPKALAALLGENIGVLSGTTAFGKTVVALNLIAKRKVNTLIIVDKVSLVTQWRDRIDQYLMINESLPEMDSIKKRGRKKKNQLVGQIGAGKDQANGIIDIAVMQSLNRKGEIKDLVLNYGMVIVDECHHVSAFSFEEVLKHSNACYVYGLTATPTRKDGHHPIIFMQCGPIRFRDDAINQALKRPFDHVVIPRFTSFRLPTWQKEEDMTIQDVYSELVKSESRNQQIVEDVIRSYESGRNCIVLTGRTIHVEELAEWIRSRIPEVITLTGGMGTKATREAMKRLKDVPESDNIVVVATGKYIGEGFDEPRLDTLFLAMPISWKGTLQQYAGRLHRLYEGKKEVQVYDYIDLHVKVLEKMYNRRLAGYASIGYKSKGEQIDGEAADLIFDKDSFLPIFSQDMMNARREIFIVSPFVTMRRVMKLLETLKEIVKQGVEISIVTRPEESFPAERRSEFTAIMRTLENVGIKLAYRSGIHQKFALIDQKIVWYGSINLLSYGSSEESMMRLNNGNIAFELMRSFKNLEIGD